MKFLTPLAVLVAAWMLLIPVLGPLLDHHFIERQPGHNHVYTQGIPVDHIHPHQVSHTHDTVTFGLTSSTDGFMFLPADDEAVPGSSGVALTAVLLALVAALVLPSLQTRALYPLLSTYRGFVPLLDLPPPRLAY